MEPVCPDCHARLEPQNSDARGDAAYCRACGGSNSLGAMVQSGPTTDPTPTAAPPGASINRAGNRYVVRASARNLPVAAWLVPFAAFCNGIAWTATISSFNAILVANHVRLPPWWPGPHTFASLGTATWLLAGFLPIAILSVPVLALSALTIAGKYQVTIEGATGTISSAIGPLGWRRRFDASSVGEVSDDSTFWRLMGHRFHQIVLGGPRKIRFGAALTDARRVWMTAVLRSLLVTQD